MVVLRPRKSREGTPDDLSRDLPDLGLPEEAQKRLLLVVDRMSR